MEPKDDKPKECGRELDRYGVKMPCGRPAGHDGPCMTWSEWCNHNAGDVIIPAG